MSPRTFSRIDYVDSPAHLDSQPGGPCAGRRSKILDEIGADFSVLSDVSKLSLGQLKVIEIARALSYEPKVLLLDETTAFLNTQEVDLLFRVVVHLKERGIAVGFISHHLDEIDRLADRFTILKDGKYVGSYPVGELESAANRVKNGWPRTWGFHFPATARPHSR